jgi:two-component system chemotaxis response regulator CheB
MRLQGVPAPVPFICPECNGALWEVRNGEVVNYRCHVGHGFAADTLLSRQAMEIEQALWSAVRGFEERAALQKRSAERKDVGSQEVRDRLLQSAREQQQMADVVRALLVGPQVEKPIVGEQFRREYAG